MPCALRLGQRIARVDACTYLLQDAFCRYQTSFVVEATDREPKAARDRRVLLTIATCRCSLSQSEDAISIRRRIDLAGAAPIRSRSFSLLKPGPAFSSSAFPLPTPNWVLTLPKRWSNDPLDPSEPPSSSLAFSLLSLRRQPWQIRIE